MKPICEKIQNRLAEDGPGALRSDDTAQQHVAGCDECYTLLESLSVLVRAPSTSVEATECPR